MDRSREGRASGHHAVSSTLHPDSLLPGFPRSIPPRTGRRLSALLFLILTVFLPSAVVAQVEPIQLEGIIVTGTPVPRTVGTETSHVTVLEGETLRQLGLSRVSEALAEVPGVVMVQNGSFGSVSSTFFRGAEADHAKVLVDGVEVNQPGGSFDFSGLLLADVERIEVVRGPASALYGSDAMAGVINIITRRGHGPVRTSVSGRGGTYGRMEWSADVQGGGDFSSYSFSASKMSSDGILAFNNQFKTSSLSGSVFLTPDDRTRVALTGRWGDKVYHFPTDGTGNVVDQNAFTYGDETVLGLEATRRFTDRLEFRAMVRSYGWDGGSEDRPDGPEDNTGFFGYASLDSFQRTSVDLRGNLDLFRGTTLSGGVELEDEEQRSFSESLSDFGPSSANSRNQRSSRGYYVHLISEWKDWSGTLGGRLEDNEAYGEFFTYQAGASYTLSGTGTRIRANLGKGMKEPTFLETHSSGFSVGNPELDPEVSMVWEAGMEQPVGNSGAQITLTWFDQTLEDLIQYTAMTPEPGGPNYFNVAEARSRGLEATGRFPLGDLLLSGGYTYLDTEVVDAGFDEGDGATFVEGEPLIRRPEHQFSLRALLSLGRGSLYGDLRVVGDRWDRNFGSWPATPVRLDRFTLLGLGADVELLEKQGSRPEFNLQIRAENLLDRRYQEVFGFRAPGRSYLVGGNLVFGG